MADLAQKAAMAKPTQFHHFLRCLHDQGKLLHVYSQNIDYLELKVGLSMTLDDQNSGAPPTCIPLHRTLEHLKCDHCGSVFALEAYYTVLKAGEFPECGRCQERIMNRVEDGKRSTSFPQIRPNVILYGQEHPQGEHIAKIQNQDLRRTDLLLVVGTSLQIRGITEFIGRFAKMSPHNSADSKLHSSSPRLIYLNNGFSNPAKWVGRFDMWIKCDCQEFARLGLEEMKEGESTSSYSKQRLDLRPSWRWWSHELG